MRARPMSRLNSVGVGTKEMALPLDRLRGEIDGEAQREFGSGPERGGRIAVGDLHRAQHLDRTARGALLDQAGALHQLDEGRGAAIHRRHLGTVDLDQHVVELEPGEGREQMLDGGDRHAIAGNERRAERRRRDVAPVGADDLVAAAEADAGIDLRRVEGHRHGRAGMKTDAAAAEPQRFVVSSAGRSDPRP